MHFCGLVTSPQPSSRFPQSTPLAERLQQALRKHVSAIHARMVVDQCLAELRLPTRVGPDEVPRLVAAARASARLFLSAERLDVVVAALEEAVRLPPLAVRIEQREMLVGSEEDLRAARTAARGLAQGLGASALGSLRVASIVTELARNLVIYTDGGRIVLEPHPGPPPRLVIIAEDTGPGIPHLDQVLAGTYRGKNGPCKGLLGVKSLAHDFAISSGPSGTRVRAEAVLG
jgi:serine/threonine-protein kinase RsbT